MPPAPQADAERVAALRKLELLDSEGHVSFDEIVHIAAMALGSSFAVISLMDESRQWFLASRGVDMTETPREIALCNYPIASGATFVLSDARSDGRFAGNRLVHEGPRIRSYLGCPVRCPDGHIVGALCAADPMPHKFDAPHVDLIERLSALVEQFVAAHARNLELRRAHLALKQAAENDELTGLLNRNGFNAPLEEAIRKRGAGDGLLFLLIIDLDGLKEANHVYGHLVGDAALQEIAARLRAEIPEAYPLARWGGDEFVLALQGDFTREAVHRLAAQALETIARPIEISGNSVYLRGSCGIAECDSGVGSKELLRRAHQALHHSTSMGPGRVHFYDRAFADRNQARMTAELEVRSALAGDRIFASYQPIINLGTGETEGYEALLRISTIDGCEVTAAQLLPALVDPELSRKVAIRMITLVASDFASLAASGSGSAFVSINATEADLLSGDYPDMLLSTLARYMVPPDRITVEITETMLLVNDLDQVKAVLDRLKAEGISIALDDFGTGFSSLTHLKVFPIDKVKIDRSFVCDITENLNAQSIVAAVIAMAQRLSIAVIAEGIENDDQLAALRRMECPMGQGFLLSPPAPNVTGPSPTGTYKNRDK
ncbi:hypothetical protein GCM10011494_27700 [Novosphingobium endophyticum]|uniref:Uncharacterized protein n=1 Tax=Novosphingobium endophyticum TaxID=1955250 RepID=A0A916X5C9_9SPHN|nr:GGDEF and EAL domain-containing protein [Novosphingobium endophyticum]GGC07552.1 hypothetical protein GCM10011494_27700 [Novosphingobium endophyticum]